jgi:hypothetical protein
MKKKILMLVASFILIFSASYAKGNNNPVPVKVSAVFSSDFSYANNVHWEVMDGYYKVSFSEHGTTLYAFYTVDGEFMGLATYLSTDRLPVALQSVIKDKYSGYWITDLFHFNINNTQGYFITLENADRKVMLKAEENRSWSFYAEVKKS